MAPQYMVDPRNLGEGGAWHTACPNTSRELTMVTPYLERTRMCHICSSQLDPAVRCVLQNSCANGFSTLD